MKGKFTLIEMLVVIAIISILASLLMPAMKSAYEVSKSISCANRLKQIGISANLYANDEHGFLPIAHTVSNSAWKWLITEPNGYQKLSQINWTNRLAPEYINDKQILKCPAGDGSELNHMGDGWYSNYTYNAYLGWVYGTGGDASKTNGGMKRITACRQPTTASLVVDGQNKSRYTTCYMRKTSRPVDRHQSQWNVLFVDGHTKSDQDSLLSAGVFPSTYFSLSSGLATDNLHARQVYQYQNLAGVDWISYW